MQILQKRVVVKVFEAAMLKIIDRERPGDFNRFNGSRLSRLHPNFPKRESCPLQQYCAAYQADKMTAYPVKSKKLSRKMCIMSALLLKIKSKNFY